MFFSNIFMTSSLHCGALSMLISGICRIMAMRTHLHLVEGSS
jgi:hypothetical protein